MFSKPRARARGDKCGVRLGILPILIRPCPPALGSEDGIAKCVVCLGHQVGLGGQSCSVHKMLTAVSLPWKLFIFLKKLCSQLFVKAIPVY